MRRSALLLYAGLVLACFSGCHFDWWHRKFHHDDYAAYNACGCDGVVAAAPIDSGPVELSHIVSSSPGTISPLVGGAPSAPTVATPAPPGTKVTAPK